MIASALPLAQPERVTTSCTMAPRSGVRWVAPASPWVHATGAQVRLADVRARDETLAVELVKVAALSAAWPRSTRFVTSLWDSFATNWIQAPVIVAPRGIAMLVQRMPTT